MTTRADILWQIIQKVTQLTSCLLPFTFQMADYGFSPSSVLQLNFSKDFCFHFVSECSRGRVWYQSMMFLCSEFQYCDTTKNRQQQAWRGKQSVQFSSLVRLPFFCALPSHVSSAFRGVRLNQENRKAAMSSRVYKFKPTFYVKTKNWDEGKRTVLYNCLCTVDCNPDCNQLNASVSDK